MELLLAKYIPQDTLSRIEVRQKLSKLKMSTNGDPKTLFEKIQTILNSAVSVKVDDEDLVAIVLQLAPKNYAQVLTAEQMSKGNKLTLDGWKWRG